MSANGGFSNAFTDSEDTVYYFDLDAESDKKMAEALSRFGSFFSAPLFSEGATGRELNAIESENSKNLQSDVFRIYQIEKSRANQDHPYSKFFTGNKGTLFEGTKRQNLDLRKELIKFYETYYSANQMTLAIVAPQSINSLKKMVSEAFEDIPNKDIPAPETAWKDIPPFLSGSSVIPSYGSIVEIVPVQDLRQVILTFPMVYSSKEEVEENKLQKPEFYASHLIGHEGPGSLLSYLKRQGWANSMGAGSEAELSDFETFQVVVDLTSKGLANLDNVVEAVFSYIRMLREEEIPKYTFDEVLNLSEIEWRFLIKGEKSNYVQSLVQAMRKYDPTLIVAGPRRLALTDVKSSTPRTSFSSNKERYATIRETQNFISKLTVDNMFMTVMSKSFENNANQSEKWYGTAYNARPIPFTTLDKWKNCFKASAVGMAFPGKNPFIPSESGLRVKKPVKKKDEAKLRTFEERMKPISPPTLIRNDGKEGRWTVHFKQDDRFGEPKAYLIFGLLTSECYSSPKNAVLAQLYQSCAKDSLDEYTYDASLAGLFYNVQITPRGVSLTFGGYNDKLGQYATYVADKLSRDVSSVLPKSDDEFERYRDNISRGLAAFDVKQPYSHAIYYSGLTVYPSNYQYTYEKLRAALATVTLEDLTSYVKTIWSSGTGEALVQGNIDKKEALDLVNTIDDALGFKTITADKYPPRLKALRLPLIERGTPPTKLTISEPNPSNKNSVSQFYFQSLGTSEKDHALIELLSAIVEQPFYEDLRTEQQLGYIVSSGVKGVEETRLFSMIVQSSVASAGDLTKAISKFVDEFRAKTLEPLDEDDFSSFVKGLIDRKTEPDKKLSQETTRNWSELVSGRFQFDRVQKEAAALLSITKDDLLEFWDEIFAADAKNGRRMLVTEIIPRTGAASSKAPPLSTGYAEKGFTKENEKNGLTLGIDDIARFRKDRENA